MANEDFYGHAMRWHNDLWNSPGPRAWLQRRGLNSETLSKHKIGFVSTDEAADGFSRFRGCISIPYFNGPRDDVVTFSFRRPDGQIPKYDKVKGIPASLFNISATEEPVVYLTEGEFDAMVLGQLGMAACGVPGVTNFKPAWRYLFRDCERAVVVFDGDEAGQRGAARIAGMLRDVTSIEVVELPIGRDVTDLYLTDPGGLKGLLT